MLRDVLEPIHGCSRVLAAVQLVGNDDSRRRQQLRVILTQLILHDTVKKHI